MKKLFLFLISLGVVCCSNGGASRSSNITAETDRPLMASYDDTAATTPTAPLLDPKAADFFSKDAAAWSTAVDLSRARADNEYDVIVVGSGLGGLTAAATLAYQGYKVLVLEQDYQVGGYSVSYRRDQYWFTAGIENISGLWVGSPYRALFDLLLSTVDISFDDLFELNRSRYVIGDKNMKFYGPTNPSAEDVIVGQWPEKEEAIRAFFAKARSAYENKCLTGERDADWYGRQTYQDMLDRTFPLTDATNLPIQNLLKELAQAYLASSAEKLPAALGLGAGLSYFIKGGYYVKGEFNGKYGTGAFVEALAQVVRAHGGAVQTDARVYSIVAREPGDFLVHTMSQATGDMGETQYQSPIVLLNANAYTGFKLFAPQLRSIAKEVEKLKFSPSGMLYHFGLPGDIFEKNNEAQLPTHVVIKRCCTLTLQVLGGNTSITITTMRLPAGLPPRLIANPKHPNTMIKNPAYEDFKAGLAADWAKKLPGIFKEKLGIDIDPADLFIGDVATPATFERYTAMPHGAWYSFSQENSKKLYFKTPVQGLYLASASAGGGGVEAAIGTGLRCVADIMGKNLNSWPKTVKELGAKPTTALAQE